MTEIIKYDEYEAFEHVAEQLGVDIQSIHDLLIYEKTQSDMFMYIYADVDSDAIQLEISITDIKDTPISKNDANQYDTFQDKLIQTDDRVYKTPYGYVFMHE